MVLIDHGEQPRSPATKGAQKCLRPPVLIAVGNVPKILDKMQAAGSPPKFTIELLKVTLGFTASQDRGLIKVLKQLRFPTQMAFRLSGTTSTGRRPRAARHWRRVFRMAGLPCLADEKANERSVSELPQMFKFVMGQGEASAVKMASTFKTLPGKADWTGAHKRLQKHAVEEKQKEQTPKDEADSKGELGGLSLHHDIHVHLPPPSDVSVYKAIFRVLGDQLM